MKGDVAQRPESFVGQPAVILALDLLGQPDASQRVERLLGRNENVIPLVDYGTVGGSTAMRYPDTPRGAHDRVDCSG